MVVIVIGDAVGVRRVDTSTLAKVVPKLNWEKLSKGKSDPSNFTGTPGEPCSAYCGKPVVRVIVNLG